MTREGLMTLVKVIAQLQAEVDHLRAQLAGREEREEMETGYHVAPPWLASIAASGFSGVRYNKEEGSVAPQGDVGQGETGKASPPLAKVPNERDMAARAEPEAGSGSTTTHHEGLHPALEAAPSPPVWPDTENQEKEAKP